MKLVNTSGPRPLHPLLPPSGLGGASADHPGDHRRVAEDAGPVAVPGAHLLLGGHHAADARGGAALPDRGQDVEGGHEALRQGPQGDRSDVQGCSQPLF